VRNSLADNTVSEEEGEGGAPVAGEEVLLWPVERIMVKQAVLLQPMVYHGEADLHAAAHEGDHSGAGGSALKEAVARGEPLLEQIPGWSCSLWRGDHAGAGDLAGGVTHGGPRLEQFAPDGWPHSTDPYLEQFLKSCCPWEAHAGSVQEGRHPVGGTPHCVEAESDREGAAETKSCRLTATPISPFPCPTFKAILPAKVFPQYFMQNCASPLMSDPIK